jgi:uncharacterized protein YdhG (YjbR/CyaY superfamily)
LLLQQGTLYNFGIPAWILIARSACRWVEIFAAIESAGPVMNKSSVTTIDEYIAQCPTGIQPTLKELRKVIRESAPKATEKMSYNMPTFSQEGNLVYFAVFTNHIGFYPLPKSIQIFEKELSKYKQGKGSIQFPIDKPLPFKLISKIVKFRVKENIESAKKKLIKNRKS